MSKGQVYALTVLVAASLALNVALFLRQRDLERRLGSLERKPAAPRSATAPTEESSGPLPERRESAQLPANRMFRDDSRSSGATGGSPLPEATREAIEREVEKRLAEREKNRGAGVFSQGEGVLLKMEEPIAVLERELALTPAQKERIAAIWKRRDEELREQAENGSHGREMMKRFIEIQERYDEEVKRELDVAQQRKFDELQKSGRLMGGGVMFAFKGEPDKK